MDLVISDGHKGIQTAVERTFPGSSWQMCHVHFIRAVLRKIPRKYHKEIAERLKGSLNDPTQLLLYAKELAGRGFSRAADTMERFHEGLLNYQVAPVEHWKRIRSTNLLERIHKELKRRTKSIGAFPNDQSLLRLVVSILIDINEEWITGKRYLSFTSEIVTKCCIYSMIETLPIEIERKILWRK